MSTRPVLAALRSDGADPLIRARTAVEIVDDPTPAFVAQWDELATVSGVGPLLGPHPALAWWRHRGHGRLHLVTARVDGRLVALAPLHRRQTGVAHVLRWLGHGLGTVGEVLVRPGFGAAAGAIWEHVAADQGVLLELLEYRDDGGGLAQLRRSRLRYTAALRDVCPVVDPGPYTSAAELLERLHRRHPLRRALARSDRMLAGGRFDVDVAVDPDGLARLLPDLTAVYDAAESRRPRLHLLRAPWRAYLLDVLDGLLARGAATVFLARVDGRPAAFEITVDGPAGAAGAATMASWVARFDPACADVTPGHLLTRAVVDHAISCGATRYDLMLGDGPHKLPWATGSYDTLTVYAAAGPLWPRRAALAAVRAVRRRGRRS